MNYSWDHKKRLSNLLKHGIEFCDAVMVFEDISALTIQDPYQEEERFITLGRDTHNRILVVIYAYQKMLLESFLQEKPTRKNEFLYLLQI